MEKQPKNDSENGASRSDTRDEPDALDIAVAPAPAADEAVKAALNVAESVGRSETPDDTLGLPFDNLTDSVSLNQIIDQAEQRSKALFERGTADVHEPLEELDILDITAQFGRPSESIGAEDASADSVNGFGDTKDLSPSVIPPPEKASIPAASPIERAASPRPNTPAEKSSGERGGQRSTGPSHTDRTKSARSESATPPAKKTPVVQLDPTPSTGTAPPATPEEDENENVRQLVKSKLSAIKEGTYFEILNVSATATDQEVRDAYRHLLSEFREERFKDTALSDMRKDVRLIRTVVSEAFEVLRRSDAREVYRRASLDDGG